MKVRAEEFDRAFDEGQDVTDFLEASKARRPLGEQKRINLDVPTWMLDSLDREARRLGVNRQAIIKIWLAERLEQMKATRS